MRRGENESGKRKMGKREGFKCREICGKRTFWVSLYLIWVIRVISTEEGRTSLWYPHRIFVEKKHKHVDVSEW